MQKLSIEEARSVLLGEDILPMSVVDDPDAGANGKSPDDPASGDAQAADAPDRAAPEGDAETPGRAFDGNAVGLGMDIVEIERMKNILARRPNFAKRVFSVAEQLYCERQASPATHYALRFAAKEAVVKALGTGFSDGIWVDDIEVDRDKKGKPFVKLSGRALEVAEEQGVRELSLSLSYTHHDAVACAMAITESSVRATEKRKDPMEELARQFKETRKMLDEL